MAEASFVNNSGNGAGISAAFCDIILTTCFFANNVGPSGGALYVTRGSTQSTGGKFVNNKAAQGGAHFIFQSNAVFQGDTFDSNQASVAGGALYQHSSSLMLTDATFISNAVTPSVTASGGGSVYSELSNLTMTGSSFTNDSGGYGGSIQTFSSNVQLSNSQFTGCQAAFKGGAVYLKARDDYKISAHNLTLSSCNASSGGGAYAEGNVSFVNCSFTDNTAVNYGGGVDLLLSGSVFEACDFERNCAGINGSAFWVESGQPFFDRFVDQNQENCTTATTTTTTTSSTAEITTTTTTTASTAEITTTTTTTDSTSTMTSTSSTSNCSVSCPTEVVDNGGNTTWEVVENTTEVRVTVPSMGGNSSLSFQIGWGSIREVTTKGRVVKTVDPLSENWPRLIEQNDTAVVITYSTTEMRPPWQNETIRITLTTILTLQPNASSNVSSSSNGQVVAAAKFSLDVEGDWQFEQEVNKLEVDFIVRGSFEATSSCGKQEKFRLDKGDEESVYHFGAVESSAVSLGVAEWCVVDNVRQGTDSLTPVFYENNTAVTVTIRFPSFRSSLYYDPNFGLLLGFDSSSECDQLLAWILPVSFLGGAALIILVVVALSFIPAVQLVILGPEGSRVRHLRDFITENSLALDADLAHYPSTNNDAWA